MYILCYMILHLYPEKIRTSHFLTCLAFSIFLVLYLLSFFSCENICTLDIIWKMTQL